MEKSKISYAEAIGEVEQILARFNDEQMDIDEMGKQVKRAAELIRLCKERKREHREEGRVGKHDIAAQPPAFRFDRCVGLRIRMDGADRFNLRIVCLEGLYQGRAGVHHATASEEVNSILLLMEPVG